MALPQLTEEEIRTWTPEQKDRWWLENVYRGSMPQLTLRSAITGFFLGGVLSATNLYIGAKTGWTLGVGVTSVILSFVIFRILSGIGASRDLTILENNAVQSIATAAGYMTGPLISALMAYMFVTNTPMEWHKMLVWNVLASILGVMVAFPMKRRFINDEQQPFPEGRACAVVLDSLYPHAPKGGTRNMVDGAPVADPTVGDGAGVGAGVFKAKALFFAAAIGAGLQILVAGGYMAILQIATLRFAKAKDELIKIPERLDEWYYHAAAANPSLWTPNVKGTSFEQLGVTVAFDLSMIGAGGLMGLRIANSVMLGMVVNFLILAPLMISAGEIVPKNLATIVNPDGSFLIEDGIFGRPHLVNTWCLWWGVAMMVTASMVGLFAKPKMILSAFTGIFQKKKKSDDCLRDIEFPLSWSMIGVPIFAAIIIGINYVWFDVPILLGILSIPLIVVLTLIAANATALTSTTPTGSLSKITQFTFGALHPTNPGTNLMTAGVTTEVASNASNLLMDIKPGYMLGAKPRQQAIGHIVGIVAGALASTPLFFILFLWNRKPDVAIEQHVTETWAVPGALQWAAISRVIEGMGHAGSGPMVKVGGDGVARLFDVLPVSAAWAMLIGALVAILFEGIRIARKGKFPLSAVGVGLGAVLPPESTIMMWIGAAFFTFFERRYHQAIGTFAWRLWVDSKEAICAGLIAGWAILGIGDGIISAFLAFPEEVAEVRRQEARATDIGAKLGSGNVDPAELAEFTTLLREDEAGVLDQEAATKALAAAAAGGAIEAHVALGDIAQAHGDAAAALGHYEAAMKAGSTTGLSRYALLLATQPDSAPETTMPLLEKAATADDADAQYELAIRLLATGAEADRARSLLEKAAAAKHGPAAWRLAQMLAAQPGLTPDAKLRIATLWVTAVNGRQRDAKVMLDDVAATILASDDAALNAALARIATAGSAGRVDAPLAVTAWRRAHELGDVNATLELARAIGGGRGTDRDDAAAATLLAAEAKRGSTAAMVELGEMLARISDEPAALDQALKALGVTDAPAEANRLWQEAATLGNARAMFDLGWQAYAGWGRPTNATTAIDWWRRGADAGDGRSMYRLGRMLAEVANDGPSRSDALLWLRLAAARRVAGAAREASEVALLLTPEELKAVESRVTAWTPTSPSK